MSGAAGPSNADVPAAEVETAAGGAGGSKGRDVSLVSLANSHLAGRIRDVWLILSKLSCLPRVKAIDAAANPEGARHWHLKGLAGLCFSEADYTVAHLEEVGLEKGDLIGHLCRHPELVGKIWREGDEHKAWREGPRGGGVLWDTEESGAIGGADASIPFTQVQGRPGLFRFIVERVLLYVPTGLRVRQIVTLAYKLDLLRGAEHYAKSHKAIKNYVSQEMWRRGVGVPFAAVKDDATGAVLLFPRSSFPSGPIRNQAERLDVENESESEEAPTPAELEVSPDAVASALAASALVAEAQRFVSQKGVGVRPQRSLEEDADEYDEYDEDGEDEKEEEGEPSSGGDDEEGIVDAENVGGVPSAAAAATATGAAAAAAAVETASAFAAAALPRTVLVPVSAPGPFAEYSAFVRSADPRSLISGPMATRCSHLLGLAKAELIAAGSMVDLKVMDDVLCARAKLFNATESVATAKLLGTNKSSARAKFDRLLQVAGRPLYDYGLDKKKLSASTLLLLRGPFENQAVETPPAEERERNRFPAAGADAAAAAASFRGNSLAEIAACFWNAAVPKGRYDRCLAARCFIGASIADAIRAYEAHWFPELKEPPRKKLALFAIAEGGICFSRSNRRNLPWLCDYHVFESPPVWATGAGGRGMYVLVNKAELMRYGVSVELATRDKSFLHVVLSSAWSPPVNVVASHLPCHREPRKMTLTRLTGSVVRALLAQGQEGEGRGALVVEIGDQNLDLNAVTGGSGFVSFLLRLLLLLPFLALRLSSFPASRFFSSRFISFRPPCLFFLAR